MKSRFIIGRAGAGKTSRCLNEIAQNIKDGWSKPLLLLVPNQFSLEMEKNLVEKTGGRGMDLAQVLSFERFSYRVFSLYGKPAQKTLDEVGKAALLRKIMYDNRNRLTYYGGAYGKEGFIRQICALFTEFYKYGIAPERLDAISKAEISSPLSSKLGDISLVFKRFSEYISSEYITLEQNLDLLAEALPHAYYFHGSRIWLDGFYRFTEQDYRVISRLCDICDEMTVTLTIPESGFPDGSYLSPYDPFFETKATALRLNNIFAGCGGAEAEVVRLLKQPEYGYSEPLTHLEKQYFYFSPDTYNGGGESVYITGGGSVYEEAERVAGEIVALVRERRLRYKDIAVCACDLQGSEHVLRDTFRRYEIPYFIDMNKTLYSKRLVEMIRALVDTGVSTWSAESVIRLLRTGLLEFSEQETDILENYILEYGIKGYKWKSEWKRGARNERYSLETLNSLRIRLLETADGFLRIFENGRKTAFREAAAALFDFIERNGVKQRLLALEENSRETAQIWSIVVSVFDKLVELLSDEKTDIKTFAQIIEGALQGVTEGFIPQTADAVVLGDIKRTRLPALKALFVLGMNDGIIPSSKEAEGIFTDADRLLLAENGAALAPSGIRQTVCEQFLIYNAIIKPKWRLYLSWPSVGGDGEELKKSIIVDKLAAIFPEAGNLYEESNGLSKLYSKKPFLSEIAVKAGELKNDGSIDGVWAEGLRWLCGTDYLRLISEGAFSSRRLSRLSVKAVERFVKKDIYSSVTRVEKYIKCPFSYFTEYGLKASERPIYGLRPVDMGNVFHSTLESLSSVLEKKGLKWGELGENAASLIDESIDEACEGLDIFQSSEKNKYLVSRLKRIARRAVWALDYHVRSGSFTPYEHETGFGTEHGLLPPIVVELDGDHRFVFSGRIDRVDIYDKDGARYVKIIDYKSGGKSFDLREAYYGLQLQLLLYLDAYLKSGENMLPAGIFYFRVTDPVINEPQAEGDEAIEDGLLSRLKLSGLVVNAPDIIGALHNNLSGASNIIPVRLKKPGKDDTAAEPDAYSSVATMEQFYMLMKRATDVIKEAGKRLVSGDIEPRPIRGVGVTPCTYCGYGSICGFDANAGYRYRNLKRLKTGEVLELLENNND